MAIHPTMATAKRDATVTLYVLLAVVQLMAVPLIRPEALAGVP